MDLRTTIELDNKQIRELITKALGDEGIEIAPENSVFVIEKVEHGNQRDNWETSELTKIKIVNIKMHTRPGGH